MEQLETQEREAALTPLRIDGREVELHGWGATRDDAALGQAVGLDPALLVLGFALFEGFPEDARLTREHVRGVRELFELFPIGSDTSDIVPLFMIWGLDDEHWGLRHRVDDASVAARLARCVNALERRLAVPTLLSALRDEHHRWITEVGRQWQDAGRVEDAVYENLRGLDAAIAACEFLAGDATPLRPRRW